MKISQDEAISLQLLGTIKLIRLLQIVKNQSQKL